MHSLLELITSAEKAEAMLASPVIKIIFTTLVFMFVITVLVHLVLFYKLKQTRNYVRDTQRMDIAPLQSMQQDFQKAQVDENIRPETFVQTKFSAWRVFNVPVVSLMKLVQMTVSIFILLGVLGTFIGLTISLASINAADEQLVENIAQVLTGIDVAFYTSIIGMSFSLIMTVLIKLFNAEYMLTDLMLQVESILEEGEQEGMRKLIKVSEGIQHAIVSLEESNQTSLNNMEEAFSGFQEYTDGLQQSARDLAIFNDGLAENLEDFKELFNHMQQVTDGFGEGIEKLNKNFDSLFVYFKKNEQKNERMAHAFEKTYEKINTLTDSQIESMENVEKMTSELKTFTSGILDGQKELHDAYGDIQQETHQLADTMAHHNDTFKHIFGRDLSAKLSGIVTYIKELSGGFDKIGDTIVKLPEALEVINQTQAEHKHLLTDRFAELKDFNQTFHHHLKDHSNESDTFIRMMGEASKTYEQLGKQNNQLMKDVNRTVQHIEQTFRQQDNQLEKGIDVLKDTLSSYVMNVDGTLTKGLEQTAGKLTDSVSTLEGKINDELRQLSREMSDASMKTSDQLTRQWRDIQQEMASNNAHTMREQQNLFNTLTNEIQALNSQLGALRQQNTNPLHKGPGPNAY
ncbi:MAG TPA: MotA/TolQ/ExbB proton channel family protein [Bacillota bacterium]|nr:MotA/TolQ/ExbB proton channel family protein [Bacillota bacterium]